MHETARVPSRESLDVIRQLVQFNTVSDHSNLPLIEWVQKYLAEYGVQSRLTFDPKECKANLFATIGPAGDGGIILSGHTDTVPVVGQAWTTSPFEATVRDGRLYGRGTVDMKGFIGVCLALVPQMVATRLSRPFHVALNRNFGRTMASASSKAYPPVSRKPLTIAMNAAVIFPRTSSSCHPSNP